MEKTQEFLFRLLKITTEQFAVFEDNYNENDLRQIKLDMGVKVQYRADFINRKIGVFFQFEILNNDKPVLLNENGLHFEIVAETWNNYLADDGKSIILPKEYACHLVAIAVGTTRGILHAKTESTRFNELIVPLIFPDDLIEDDLVMKL